MGCWKTVFLRMAISVPLIFEAWCLELHPIFPWTADASGAIVLGSHWWNCSRVANKNEDKKPEKRWFTWGWTAIMGDGIKWRQMRLGRNRTRCRVAPTYGEATKGNIGHFTVPLYFLSHPPFYLGSWEQPLTTRSASMFPSSQAGTDQLMSASSTIQVTNSSFLLLEWRFKIYSNSARFLRVFSSCIYSLCWSLWNRQRACV
jgi:hypothetical protein